MRLAHTEDLSALRSPTPGDPWRVLVSGCIAGLPCGVDATDFGMAAHAPALLRLPTVRTVPFCPETHGMGAPRTMPDLHGGDGFDALDGRARVLDEQGVDLTDAMLAGARAMVEVALAERVDFAVLTDMSAACGSQVIADGCRFDSPRRYRAGVGVAAAALLRAGVPVVSQRDHRTLARLRVLADPGWTPPQGLRDHHQHPWYVEAFGVQVSSELTRRTSG